MVWMEQVRHESSEFRSTSSKRDAVTIFSAIDLRAFSMSSVHLFFQVNIFFAIY